MKKASRVFTKAVSLLLTCLLIFSAAPMTVWQLPAFAAEEMQSADNTARQVLNFNNNWKFSLGQNAGAQYKGYSDEGWSEIDVPYDFSITQPFSTVDTENESGNLPGGTGWYRKWFTLPSSVKEKRLILSFGGVYQDAYVYVNGSYVGENHYGYNAFAFDITDYVISDGITYNLIAVKAVNTIPSSRWYSGSGITQDVTLSVLNPVHISQYGTKVTTPANGSGASAAVTGEANTVVTLENNGDTAQDVRVVACVLDANGQTVSNEKSASLSLGAHASGEVTLAPSVNDPALWSTQSPTLYTLRTEVYAGDTLLDSYDTVFGYRTIYWDAANGFYLNGVPTKIKGVCLHADQGALGAVQARDAIARQIRILKDMGCNAIRSSHNVPSSALVEICNTYGMLLMDEFFDGWDTAKDSNTNDFSAYFLKTISSANTLLGAVSGQAWYNFVAAQTIKRDRNSPCVILWSGGNEINNIVSATPNYSVIAPALRTLIHELDDRPWTVGDNNKLAALNDYVDVVGLNYNISAAKSSAKPFIATEASSAVSSRGVYRYKENQSVEQSVHYASADDLQINAYDASFVYWGNTAAEAWYNAVTKDWWSGEFMWTGFDYIGEPTPFWTTTGSYNNSVVPNSSYFGAVDTAGFEKDAFYLYRSLWNDTAHTLHLLPGTWDQSALGNQTNIPVAVYSNAARIELYLNGTKIGHADSALHTSALGHSYRTWTATADTSACSVTELAYSNAHSLYPQFSVRYAAGTLSVKAFDENGAEITDAKGTQSVSSANEAVSVSAAVRSDLADRPYTADGESYIYVEYTAKDANGYTANDFNGSIGVQLSGTGVENAVIVGADNGNPATTQKFRQSGIVSADGRSATVSFFNGKALVILRTRNKKEPSVVSVVQSITDTAILADGVTFQIADDTVADEFEEVYAQSGGSYTPTVYDDFYMYKSEIDAMDLEAPTVVHANYSPFAEKTLESGDYAITGYDDNDGTRSSGVMTSTAKDSTSLVCTGSYTVDANATVWHFEKNDNGTFVISTKNANGSTVYLNISSSAVTLTNTPQDLTVAVTSSGDSSTVKISRDGQYINFYGGSVGYNTVGRWTSGSPLTLYYILPQYELYNRYTAGNTETKTETTETSHTVYRLVTSVTSGKKYVILTRNSTGNGYALRNTSGTTLNRSDALTVKAANSNVSSVYFENPADTAVWTITGSGTTFQLRNVSTGLYLSIPRQSSTLTTSQNAVNTIVSGSSGAFTFRNASNGYYLRYASNAFSANRSATNLYLYEEYTYTESKTETQTRSGIENGVYVLYNPNRVLSAKAASDNTIGEDVCSLNGEQLTACENCEYTFQWISGDTYTVRSKDGKYLSVASGALRLTDAYTELSAFGLADGNVLLYKNSDFISHDREGKAFGSAVSSTTAPGADQILTLYKNTDVQTEYTGGLSGTKGELCAVLQKAVSEKYKPGTYTELTYTVFMDALQAGIAVFNDPDAADAELEDAARALSEAMDALTLSIRKFNSTLYKYGFGIAASNANDSTIYANNAGSFSVYGGHDYNVQSVYQMQQAILASSDLRSQLEARLNGINFTNNTNRETAIRLLAEQYARLYTLQFHGMGVNSSSRTEAGDVEYSTVYDSAWNFWTKRYTEGTGVYSTGEEKEYGSEDGAAVMGLFGNTLSSVTNADGTTSMVPMSHAAYDLTNGLSYQSPSSHASDWGRGIQSNNTVSVNTGSGTATVTLTPLNNISVFAPDFFSRNDVRSNDYNGDGTTDTYSTLTTQNRYGAFNANRNSVYSKYYWDTQFPFLISTDEFGINTYEYSSSAYDPTEPEANLNPYVFRAYYDTPNHKAVSTLQPVKSWGINTNKGGNCVGLFPFNYELSSPNGDSRTEFTGEDAIYHYGMTFNTDFTLPRTPNHKYSNGDDVVFYFSGDDDVLVYVDNRQILDDGGLHGARSVEINFTQESLTYQYAFDITTGKLTTQTDSGATQFVTYTYNNGDILTTTLDRNGDGTPDTVNAAVPQDVESALQMLHSLWSSNKDHTLNFFFMERGSSESNCIIRFNLQPTEGYVHLDDQELVADYGLDIPYDVVANNFLEQESIDAGSYYSYLGLVTEGHEDNLPSMSMTYDETKLDYAFEEGKRLTIEGKYGTYSLLPQYETNEDGSKRSVSCDTTYTLRDMRFTGEDTFYLVAKVIKDPIFTNEIYYTYEKVVYVPATSIYFEDDFRMDSAAGITYIDGSTYTGYSGAAPYGRWTTDTSGIPDAVQDADPVADAYANVYGHDSHYDAFAQYSNNQTHKVAVSTANSTVSSVGGGSGAAWPKAQFTFAGTGFDVISLTSQETGVFVVSVYNGDGSDLSKANRVRYSIVDTYYGYSYGQVYMTADGTPTLAPTAVDESGNTVPNAPMFKSMRTVPEEGTEPAEGEEPILVVNGEKMSRIPTYYQNDGTFSETVQYHAPDGFSTLYTDTPTYYDADGNVVLTAGENAEPAYAYAYGVGWLIDENGDTDALYQIPVMKIHDLDYGTYTAVIEARYTGSFNHGLVDADGLGYYDLYLDAIRVYDPAGVPSADEAVAGQEVISEAYMADHEGYPYYSEIKNMLIGADTIDADGVAGVLFIDGMGEVGSDRLDAYKMAGPNNELYLNAGQSVAFEILTTSAPTDVQISAKIAKSADTTENNCPILSFSYGENVYERGITSATDMYYSIAENLQLTWQLTMLDGVPYYTSGTIVIGNSAEPGSNNILSVTNLKWTFDVYGATGYYRIPTTVTDESARLMVSENTLEDALTMLSYRYVDLSIRPDAVKIQKTTVEAGEDAVLHITTSKDVESLRITDPYGNPVTARSIDFVTVQTKNGERKMWTVCLSERRQGTYEYDIQGVCGNDYADAEPVRVRIKVTPYSHVAYDEAMGVFETLFRDILNMLKELFREILRGLGFRF